MEEEVKKEVATSNSSKSKAPLIIGVVVLMVICCVGGIFIGKSLNKDKKGEENKQEEQKEIVLSEDIIKQTDDFIKYTKSTYRNITADELPGNEKLYLAYQSLEADNYKKGDYSLKFSKKEMEERLVKFFGKDVKYTHGDIYTIHEMGEPEVIIKYDSKKEEYELDLSHAHGYTCPEGLSNIVSRTIVGNKLEVKVRRVYYLTHDTGPIIEIFYDPELKEEINVPEKYTQYFDGDDDPYPDIDAYLKSDEKADNLVYEFELVDGNPIFKRLYLEK